MFPLPTSSAEPNVQALARLRRETRTGSVSATWDLTNPPIAGFELFYKNGLLLQPVTDYTVSGKRITFAVAPGAGDRTTAIYYYPGA